MIRWAVRFYNWVITHKVAAVLWSLVLAPLVIGIPIKGLSIFTLDPLGLPNDVEVLWFGLNGFLSFMAAALVLRSLIGFRSLWTRQELWVSRGIFLIVYGGMIGYWVRAFTASPGVSIATPYLTIGLSAILYGTARFPDRFTKAHLTTEGQIEV